MKMTNGEYGELVDRRRGRSPLGKDLFWAFFIGGAICALGQLLLELYERAGVSPDNAPGLVSITLVALGALLTGLGIYDDIARRGGAGTLVPITGFSNAMVSPALEFKAEGIITGSCAKMFSIAGPVLVLGTCASAVYGLVLMLLP
ncbi:MAG: SpoVA/SpoVAEb family sporulation membrane protein [Oscillospiraceae bacterium]|nr:SpoVA/SpoVAEb family sporulation membrane protein [Oscillospiraceae bacterium]